MVARLVLVRNHAKLGMVYLARIGQLKIHGTNVACEESKEDKALIVIQKKERKIIQ
jgi:hypothetical protein